MNWKYLHNAYVYVNDEGKILGRVGEAWGGEWWAETRGTRLGNYIDRESAKKAVERAFMCQPLHPEAAC
jgi:hypothetical protein